MSKNTDDPLKVNEYTRKDGSTSTSYGKEADEKGQVTSPDRGHLVTRDGEISYLRTEGDGKTLVDDKKKSS